jgi:hypothetical protein
VQETPYPHGRYTCANFAILCRELWELAIRAERDRFE